MIVSEDSVPVWKLAVSEAVIDCAGDQFAVVDHFLFAPPPVHVSVSAFRTPAANNLVLGSSFGILLGAPLLVLVSIAQKSFTMSLITLGLLAVYYVILILIVNIKKKKGAK